MKTRNKVFLIAIILFSGLIVIPATISIGSTFYCNSVASGDCIVYSISLLPNFRPVIDEVLGKDESQRQYDTSPATCNNIMGKPDGKCFVKSFQECKHASIKNKLYAVEGDPIFYYAYIDVDDCLLRYHVDLRQDGTTDNDPQDFRGFVCSDIQLNDHELSFQCEDERLVLPLR